MDVKVKFLGVKIIEDTGILVILVREVKAELWNLLLHRFSKSFARKIDNQISDFTLSNSM